MLELKYEYFPSTWPGRIKIIEMVLALLCIMCAAPATYSTQHWFLLVVSLVFLGTIFFSLYYLCLAEPLNKLGVNWIMAEFWFTSASTFLYFTAFLAQLVDFAGWEWEEYQYWVDAQVAAGVIAMINNLVYAAGAYLIYVEWQRGAAGVAAPPPV